MISEEIIGGLKLALSKGESLKQAMMSFYNAGYKKEDIEEAARKLQKENFEQKEVQQQKQEQPIKKSEKQIPKKKPQKTMQKVSSYGTPMRTQIQSSKKIKEGIDSAIEQLKKINVDEKQEIIQKKIPKEKFSVKKKPVKSVNAQKVSNYKKEPKQKGKLITFILVFFFLLLLGILSAVFLVKQELIDFFSNLF
jgi:hypothetical protein